MFLLLHVFGGLLNATLCYTLSQSRILYTVENWLLINYCFFNCIGAIIPLLIDSNPIAGFIKQYSLYACQLSFFYIAIRYGIKLSWNYRIWSILIYVPLLLLGIASHMFGTAQYQRFNHMVFNEFQNHGLFEIYMNILSGSLALYSIKLNICNFKTVYCFKGESYLRQRQGVLKLLTVILCENLFNLSLAILRLYFTYNNDSQTTLQYSILSTLHSLRYTVVPTLFLILHHSIRGAILRLLQPSINQKLTNDQKNTVQMKTELENPVQSKIMIDVQSFSKLVESP
ncbi:hypothetical protein BC833DRAFT_589999 [Globomyces pollinis-pini]|nr:hypothetical protein BC833DRAFT_589999 [Globomyces pollinis-pini]